MQIRNLVSAWKALKLPCVEQNRQLDAHKVVAILEIGLVKMQ